MKNSTVIITVQYHCTVCAIIRTICRYMYSDYGLPIILHQKKSWKYMLPSGNLVDPAHVCNNPVWPLLKVIFNVFVILVVPGCVATANRQTGGDSIAPPCRCAIARTLLTVRSRCRHFHKNICLKEIAHSHLYYINHFAMSVRLGGAGQWATDQERACQEDVRSHRHTI